MKDLFYLCAVLLFFTACSNTENTEIQKSGKMVPLSIEVENPLNIDYEKLDSKQTKSGSEGLTYQYIIGNTNDNYIYCHTDIVYSNENIHIYHDIPESDNEYKGIIIAHKQSDDERYSKFIPISYENGIESLVYSTTTKINNVYSSEKIFVGNFLYSNADRENDNTPVKIKLKPAWCELYLDIKDWRDYKGIPEQADSVYFTYSKCTSINIYSLSSHSEEAIVSAFSINDLEKGTVCLSSMLAPQTQTVRGTITYSFDRSSEGILLANYTIKSGKRITVKGSMSSSNFKISILDEEWNDVEIPIQKP